MRHIKTILSLFLVFSIVSACATGKRKKSKKNGILKEFRTQYNTLFNAEQAMLAEKEFRKEAYKDNFYQDFIPLFPLDEEIKNAENSLSIEPAFGGGFPSRNTALPTEDTDSPVKPATRLDIVIAKAKKAKEKYGFVKNGDEQNKKIFDASLLMAKAYIYQGKPLEALDALQFIFKNMKNDKRLPQAFIWQGVAYTKLKDYDRARIIFSRLEQDKLSKSESEELALRYADMLIEEKKYEQAVSQLNKAIALNPKNAVLSRVAFVKGQLLTALNRRAEARESYMLAYQKANDFEFEVKSQIAVAKTYLGADGYAEARNYLEKIAQKGTYGSRKNEFYYGLGMLALEAKKEQDALDYFNKSLREKQSDPQIRGMVYEELGKNALKKDDYLKAGMYFDSAVKSMTYEPVKQSLTAKNRSIKKIAQNYYLIKRNDSILRLAYLPQAEKEKYFAAYIQKLKTEEAKIALEKRREEEARAISSGDYNANSVFAGGRRSADFGTISGTFYFANNTQIARGSSDFRQIWGDRALADNWRYNARNTIQEANTGETAIADTKNPRRFEVSYYTERLPQTPEKLQELKYQRDTASLGLGRMYENLFGNTSLATKTLFELVNNKPAEETELQALYSIFTFNMDKNPAEAQRAKQILTEKYPYTPFAEYARNPKSQQLAKSNPSAEADYLTAYNAFTKGEYPLAESLSDHAIQKYPSDILVPKFYLLKALTAGKQHGKEVMILQLEQISLNYADTPEGEHAKELLRTMGSGSAKMEMRNAQGQLTAEIQTAEENYPVFGAPGKPDPQINSNENKIRQRVNQQEIKEQNPPINRR